MKTLDQWLKRLALLTLIFAGTGFAFSTSAVKQGMGQLIRPACNMVWHWQNDYKYVRWDTDGTYHLRKEYGGNGWN
jgi:hypothetical protein